MAEEDSGETHGEGRECEETETETGDKKSKTVAEVTVRLLPELHRARVAQVPPLQEEVGEWVGGAGYFGAGRECGVSGEFERDRKTMG